MMSILCNISLMFLLLLIKANNGQNIDLSTISYSMTTEMDDKFITITCESKDWKMKVSCRTCDSVNDKMIKCKENDLVKVVVELSREERSVLAPFNISCSINQNAEIVRHIKPKPYITSTLFSWNVSNINIRTFIIFYMEKDNYKHEIFTTETLSYLLKGLKEKTLYKICIATINDMYVTGKYVCVDTLTDFAETGPVEDVVIMPSSDQVNVTWKKPSYKEDYPEGYIITYLESEGSCGTFIITMNGLPIINNEKCSNKKYENWSHLGPLLISGLKPFRKYEIYIYPIIKDKKQIKVSDSFDTKEGKSGPVSNIEVNIIEKWLRIKYIKPVLQNGIVRRYKINLTLLKVGLCKEVNNLIYTNSDVKVEYEDIEISKVTKCGSYKVEIYPINGWSLNEGLGEMADNEFNFSSKNTFSISNLKAKLISSNMIRISWDNSLDYDDCDEINYMVEISSESKASECKMLIIANESCDAFDAILRKQSNCVEIEKISQKKDGHSSSILYVGDLKSSVYKVTVWKITDSISKLGEIITSGERPEDCFSDCYSKVYKGIRSANGCVKWKDSKKKDYSDANNFFCIKTSVSSEPWCYTKEHWEKCSISKCSNINTDSGCVKVISNTASTTGVRTSWTLPDYRGSLIGYITVLYNEDNNCEQAHIQMCRDCGSEGDLKDHMKMFYVHCTLNITTDIISKSSFVNLYQNKLYTMYIVPLLSVSEAGEIKNHTFRTLLAKPDIPKNIKVHSKYTTVLHFIWDKLMESADKGLPEKYEAVLLKGETKKEVKTSSTEFVQFFSLEMCTEYCLNVYARNNAGESNGKGSICQYTLAPSLGQVTVHGIKDGPSLNRDLSFVYSKQDDCTKSYKVVYKNKFSNAENTLETNTNHIVLRNLLQNIIYTVKVRAESKLETSDKKQEGEYSKEIQFYTGEKKPAILNYKENIHSSRQQINITWSFDAAVNGSIFQFIVILKDTSKKHCLNIVNLVCKNCPDPYHVKNINANQKSERMELLICTNNSKVVNEEYSKVNYSLSYVFKTKNPLKNFTVEIYAINLMGVHKVYGKSSTYDGDYNISGATISIVCIILVCVIIFIIAGVIYKIKRRNSNIMNSISFKKVKKKQTMIETKRNSGEVGKFSSVMNKENVPLLEPKIKNCGVDLKEFHSYYERMCKNKNDLMIQEYKQLSSESKEMENGLGLTVNVGKLTSNAKKNRFINILPFDQNRVKIQSKSVSQDYINANYIPFMNDETKFEYIASQGPIEHSISDFWQMISDQNINCILMLTRTMEDNKFKCLQYWPENIGEEQIFGNKDIVVMMENEIESESHVERILIMTNKKNDEKRKIIQLHMHTWSDYSAPNLEYFDKLLFRFHELANQTVTNPYLIHCSAGVGRTGTLICIDRIIKLLVRGCQQINIYDTVFTLRHYRNFMVQRQAQYIFIHDYIEHFLNKYMKMDDTDEMIYFNDD